MEKKNEFFNYLMNCNQKEYANIMNIAASKYKEKYKKQLILENNDKSSLKDGSSPQHYFDSLTSIENWIQERIDEIRIYLKPICYPLFIHLYLDLINNKYTEEAENFLKDNRDKYKAFDDEINRFGLAKNPLDENDPLINKYLKKLIFIFPMRLLIFFYIF